MRCMLCEDRRLAATERGLKPVEMVKEFPRWPFQKATIPPAGCFTLAATTPGISAKYAGTCSESGALSDTDRSRVSHRPNSRLEKSVRTESKMAQRFQGAIFSAPPCTRSELMGRTLHQYCALDGQYSAAKTSCEISLTRLSFLKPDFPSLGR